MHGRRAAGRLAVVTAAALALLAGVALAAPEAGFDASTTSPTVGESVRFTAENACELPVVCRWSYGDGADGGGRSVSHAYRSPGAHTVTLSVLDPLDPEPLGSSSTTVTVRAPPNRPPVAAVSASTTRPAKGQAVRFDSSRSSDPDGGALTRAWDLDGDGDHDDGSGVTATRSFPLGSFTVRVRVTDPDGASDTDEVRLTVTNGDPSAAINVSDANPLSLTSVRFTAVASDPDGSIVKREWDFDKDGFDDGSGATAAWTYRVPGKHEARLRVTDNDGATSTATREIAVGNRAPKAAFGFTPNPAPKSRPVTFRSTSSDPEGRLDKHEWDLDGDGRFDDATGANATRTFPAARSRINVRLRVTDKDGGSNVAEVVIVPGNVSPTVRLTASPAAPLTAEPVTFTSVARDSDGSIVGYAWLVDGVPSGGGPSLSTSFATAGPHRVSVTVTDDAGGSSTLAQEIAVVERAPLVFTFAPNPVVRGVPVTFTAESAAGRKFRALAWDVDGDGQFDDGTGATVTITYPSARKVFVGLSGIDEENKPISVYREVEVLDGAGGPAARMMRPFPVVRFAGRLTSRGARLHLLTVKAPKGAAIKAICRGKGCPRSRILRTARVERLRKLQTSYRAGARIVLRITKPGRIGKYVRITIRKEKQPLRRDSCIWPGEAKPRTCPI